MYNDQLDDLLKEKFSPMRQARVNGTIATDVMHRLNVLEARSRLPRKWVTGYALTLGVLVCVPSL
jgi:hypothetical protein